MGERGKAPTPTPILKLRGSRLAKDREKQGEPQPIPGTPKRPEACAKGEPRKVWDAVTEMLDDMQVLSVVDGNQLERYVRYFLRWRQMERVVELHEKTDLALAAAIKNDDLRPILRNAWAESHRLNTALTKIEAQFGLTPSARARLSCLVNGNRDAVNNDDRESQFFGGVG